MSGEGINSGNPVCGRCDVSSWHPDARSCHFEDCELRASLRPAAGAEPQLLNSLGSAPVILSPVHDAGVPAGEERDHVS